MIPKKLFHCWESLPIGCSFPFLWFDYRWVLYPGGWPIFSVIITRKCSISEKWNSEMGQFPGNNFQSPGNIALKLTKWQKCGVNLQVIIPRNCSISEFLYPEVNRFPSNDTQKLFNCRVSLPGILFSWITLSKWK